MALPPVVPREQWLAARLNLLMLENELVRLRDEVSANRRQLPMTRVEKDYVFAGPDGEIGLAGLFGGCRQLIVQHFMFDPGWDAGCPSCAAASEELPPGLLARLRAADTGFAMVSMAPVSKITAYQVSRGWAFPWYSSLGSDFNYDFHVTLDETVTPVVYNFQSKQEILASGTPDDLVDAGQSVEIPGISCFVRDGGSVFHTYSVYDRGLELLSSTRSFLELTALGGRRRRA
jgi:predicted dithiol-disulfide oxidoreductase (DUF899 family)